MAELPERKASTQYTVKCLKYAKENVEKSEGRTMHFGLAKPKLNFLATTKDVMFG